MQQVPVSARIAAAKAGASTSQRPEDLEIIDNRLYVALTGENRVRALDTMADLVKPGGVILVSCRSRNQGEGLDDWPLALDRDEINGFLRAGLTELQFEAYDDTQDPPVPHFFAVYRRPA